MHKKIKFAGIFAMVFMLAGCGLMNKYSSPSVMSGNGDEVSYQAGAAENPGKAADEYCAQYRKHAMLVRTEPADSLGNLYNYDFVCK